MTVPSTQVTSLLAQFNLTTAAEELVPRLTQAGPTTKHCRCRWKCSMPKPRRDASAGLPGCDGHRVCRPARRSRRSTRGRLPGPVVQQLKTLATGAFRERERDVSPRHQVRCRARQAQGRCDAPSTPPGRRASAETVAQPRRTCARAHAVPAALNRSSCRAADLKDSGDFRSRAPESGETAVPRGLGEPTAQRRRFPRW